MASSPASERYARSLRQAGDDLNMTRQSLLSDPNYADTDSNLSVDEESSQAFNAQPLPHRGGNTKRSSGFTTRQSQDFEINTSAIGRAFPDITGSGSSIDEGSSMGTFQSRPSIVVSIFTTRVFSAQYGKNEETRGTFSAPHVWAGLAKCSRHFSLRSG